MIVGIACVSRFVDLCDIGINCVNVQEGLTAYLEWLITDETKLIALEDKVLEIRAEALRKDKTQYTIINSMNQTQDIADICFTKPPLIFHMIRATFGDAVIFRFMKYMSNRYQ